MAKTELEGPFQLSNYKINEVVTETSPGTYVLEYPSSDKTFIIKYVGRSDDDLNDRLHDWVGKYKSFKAAYFPSAKKKR
jgi:hypothetical protein